MRGPTWKDGQRVEPRDASAMPRRTALTSSAPSMAPPPVSQSSPIPLTNRSSLRESLSQPTASELSAHHHVSNETPFTSTPVVDHTGPVESKSPVPRSSFHTVAPKKKIIRPPKYHETQSFLQKESAVDPRFDLPSHLGHRVGESYRLAATMSRIIKQAALNVRPVAWGYGTKDGTLGHNNTEHHVEVMKRVAAFRGDYVRQVSAGDKISLFLSHTGRVFVSGRLFLHQDGVKMWKPQEVSFVPPISSPEDTAEINTEVGEAHNGYEDGIRIVNVEAGHLAAYAIDTQGRVYAWGTHRYGQLGIGDEIIQPSEENQDSEDVGDTSDNQEESEDDVTDDDAVVEKPLRRLDPVEPRPRRVQSGGIGAAHIVKLSAGNHFVLAMSSCGRVFSWGWNWHGQLGLGTAAPREGLSSPQQVYGLLDSFVAVDIAAGHSHSLVVAVRGGHQGSDSGRLFSRYSTVCAFGRGTQGRLGIGGEEDQSEPVEVTYFRGLQPVRVAAGHDHSLVLCSVGASNFVYAFGGNAFGQLGVAQTAMSFSDMPMVVDELNGLAIGSVGAGAYVSSALSGDGEVYTWGDGTHGKTGRPDHRTTFVPWRIPEATDPNARLNHRVVLDETSFVTQLAMGAHHSVVLYRTAGKPDRWRKFPMGAVVPFLKDEEGNENGSVSIVCKSTSVKASIEMFGITLHCDTCAIGPLCRVCSRRCHRGHQLVPRHLPHTGIDSKPTVVECACGSRQPPPNEPRLNPLGHPQRKSENAINDQGKSGDGKPSPATGYCEMTSIPRTIPEDALLR